VVTQGNEGTAASERQLIVFSLHGERYGLPIACVREIIRYTPPRVTATARGLIQGMINLRGQVLPVLDLSSRLGRALEVSGATRILIIDLSNGVAGLIVDSVDGVMRVAEDRIDDIPGAVSDDAFGQQIAAVDDQLIMLVDPERALGGALPGREKAGQGAAAADPSPPPGRPPRTPSPAARRRSAAAPQVPRSRRNPPRPT
jgi:purine-binding chemotaxis protein CheW